MFSLERAIDKPLESQRLHNLLLEILDDDIIFIQ